MKKYLLVCGVCYLAACSPSNKAAMNSTDHHLAMADDWVTLFDGKSTANWHSYNKSTAGKIWQIQDGALHLDPQLKKQTTGEGGDLITNEEYDNFDLKLEWKISAKGNSGVIFYIHEDSKIPNTYETGPEYQVLDNGTPTTPGHPDGKLYTHRAGDLYDLLAAKEAAKPQGEWNAAEIVSKNGKLDFYLNGQHTLSTTMWDSNWNAMVAISKFKAWSGFGTFKKGHIGLQDHGDEVWYRNIKIKRL